MDNISEEFRRSFEEKRRQVREAMDELQATLGGYTQAEAARQQQAMAERQDAMITHGLDATTSA
jgi:hypothetical protein